MAAALLLRTVRLYVCTTSTIVDRQRPAAMQWNSACADLVGHVVGGLSEVAHEVARRACTVTLEGSQAR
eukprot:SAG25_NODE_819_length_5219_cov_37.174219_2_plen_69_part_00